MYGLIRSSEIQNINFQIHTNDFDGYEFLLKESVFIEESESYADLFRLEIGKDGSKMILVASDEDYYIYDEVTYLFDVSEIEEFCKYSNVEDCTSSYEKWLLEIDE